MIYPSFYDVLRVGKTIIFFVFQWVVFESLPGTILFSDFRMRKFYFPGFSLETELAEKIL